MLGYKSMYCNISRDDKFISSGYTQGNIRIWHLFKELNHQLVTLYRLTTHEKLDQRKLEDQNAQDSPADHVFEAHTDCVNGVR